MEAIICMQGNIIFKKNSQAIVKVDRWLSYVFFLGKKNISRNNARIFMLYIYIMVPYEYMNSHRNDVYDLFVNAHVQIKLYLEFYYSIIYIANEGCHVRISHN